MHPLSCSSLLCCLLMLTSLTVVDSTARGDDGNRLVYLDEPCDPYYVHRTFPKLVTPQWVGDDGVEAVVTLGIDDMRDVKAYEAYLRPLLTRLQAIDGRAAVSIMTCQVDPHDPHLQTWLAEGVSLETHTANHPCPCLQGGRFADAKATYDACVDQLSAVPNSRPVAFRFPCCDSKNTPSPRAFAEILNRTTAAGNFTQISSSVAVVLTADDPDLPRQLVLDADGTPRFSKYIPFPSFVNKVENYPYPFIIGKQCWEFPIVVPDDWQGHNLHSPNNPKTLEDMKALVDATVIKQGVANIVFHPHGWIRNDQMVELVDHVDQQYGKKVKFLTFAECLQRLNQHLLAGQAIRTPDGQDNGVRLLDLNNDGFLDVVIGNEQKRLTRVWDPVKANWQESEFPVALVRSGDDGLRHDAGVRFGILRENGNASFLVRSETVSGVWHFDGQRWVVDADLLDGLAIDGTAVTTTIAGRDSGVRLRDIDADGICELVVANPNTQAVFSLDAQQGKWERLDQRWPQDTWIVDADGRDAGLRFVDVNEDGLDDILFSNEQRWSLHLFTSLESGWSDEVFAGGRGQPGTIPPFVRGGTNNGAWFADRHLWIQNEDTAKLPDGVDRRSFNDLLGSRPAHAKSPQASVQGMQVPEGFAIQLVAAEPMVQDPVDFDWGPDGRLWVIEMADYPLPIEGQEQGGGRVRCLEDVDGDGVYDQSTLFLEGLNTPTGILVWRDGVLITAAPDVLYAADTDGDGRADVRQVLFSGFGEGNQQHRVNGLRWGLDNWVYLANGDSGGTITASHSNDAVEIRGLDVRIRPDQGLIDAQSGQTQFGRNRDDWGNWFGCNNPNPIFQYLLADHYLRRNPYFAPPNPRVDIRDGSDLCYPASRVISHCDPKYRPLGAPTKFTSACGTMVYRDDWLGSGFANHTFTSEPVYNLVHRRVLVPQGNRFVSQRIPGEERSEFLRSNDPWSRPTALHVGPDGALYIADMYRQVIEHPEWIADELEQQIDVRAGADRGRIYRVAAVGVARRPVPRLDQMDTSQLVAQLDSPSGWQRDLVQRMLIWRNDRSVIPALESMARSAPRPLARLHALCTLDGLASLSPSLLAAALADVHPGVRRHALRLAEPQLRTLGEQATPLTAAVAACIDVADAQVRMQLAYTLGEWKASQSLALLRRLVFESEDDPYLMAAILSSVHPANLDELRKLDASQREQTDRVALWNNHLDRIEKAHREAPEMNPAKPKPQMTAPATEATAAAVAQREAIVDRYKAALDQSGDHAKGKKLFAKHCAVCHRLEGVGHVVGPDLTALTNRTPEAMLVAILDPNRAVEDKYRGYVAVTNDGRVITGTISAETSTTVTLLALEGKKSVLLRNEIEELVPSGKSLMPEGMEQTLSQQDVADLLAYLGQTQNAATADDSAPSNR